MSTAKTSFNGYGKLMTTALELHDWIATEKPKAKLCYFVGRFAYRADFDHEAMHVFQILWAASENGEVFLTQKRETSDSFSYWATKAARKETFLERQIRENKWR